ncbi:MAG TPA: hypothetical protein VFJ85_16355 [Acidimicrobiales bacterium]|nr:hypothetical protein [Acidimicrobiales bacterium]
MTTGTAEDGRAGTTDGHLRSCLLLLVCDAPAQGAELTGMLAGLGVAGTGRGSVRRALRSLQDGGLVDSWPAADPAGPDRQHHWATAAGAATVASWQAPPARFLRYFLARGREVPEPALAAP